MTQITYLQGRCRDADVDKGKCPCGHKVGNRKVEQIGRLGLTYIQYHV